MRIAEHARSATPNTSLRSVWQNMLQKPCYGSSGPGLHEQQMPTNIPGSASGLPTMPRPFGGHLDERHRMGRFWLRFCPPDSGQGRPLQPIFAPRRRLDSGGTKYRSRPPQTISSIPQFRHELLTGSKSRGARHLSNASTL